MKKYENLIMKGYTYRDSLPFYEGNLNGKGFPIMLDSSRLSSSKLWVSAVIGRITKEDSEAVADGKMGMAKAHIHPADMVYLLLGEQDSVTAEVTLGNDVYTVTAPSSVFIPAGLPHGIRATEAKEGMFGGICAIYYDGEYDARPVPESPLRLEDTSYLIIQGYRWCTSISSHEGGVEGKGFPILLSSELVKDAPTWITPTMPPHTPEMCEAINSGAGYVKATPHYHNDDDELYLVLGEEGSITLHLALNDEEYEVMPPAVVYLPAKAVHSVEPVHAEVGMFGGGCAVFAGKDYITIPV